MLELPPALAQDLENGQAVVVPTAARAAALRLAFTARQLARGLRAFQTPVVHSLGGWLARQTLRGADGELRRLGELDEWLLWREALAVALHDAPAPLAQLAADERLIEPLRRAAQLLCDWHIPEASLPAGGGAEHLLLARTLAQVDRLAAAQRVLPAHRVLAGLATQPPRRQAVFAGFSDLSPAHRALLAAWGGRAPPVRGAGSHDTPAVAGVVRAPDPDTELLLAAQWCRDQLRQDPRRRLLVIIPDLPQRLARVGQLFDELLMPEALLRADAEPARAWMAEGGEPLGEQPLVRHALRSLRLLCGALEFEELSDWLRSGFWRRPCASDLAGLDARLRQTLRPRCTAPQLLEALERMPASLADSAVEFAAQLRAAHAVLEPRSRLALAGWMGRFQAALSHLGLMPDAARAGSRVRQQMEQQLSELLRGCAQASAAAGALGATEALALLGRLAQQTRFEQSAGDVPVTVSAALVDPVVRYDGIRVLGLTAAVLPAPLRFDPFIAIPAQRAAGLPQASAGARLQQADAWLLALRQCASTLVLSWPERGDDREWLPSPLLREFTVQPAADPAPGGALARTLQTGAVRETFTDEAGSAWNTAVPLPKGTSAIELQSRCPFRAYAQLRLSATPLEAPVPGITPSERGKLLHRALELLWRQLEGQAGLVLARDAGTLDALVAECARRAAVETLDSPLATDDPQGLGGFRRAATAREQARAERLLRAHVRLELARAAFSVEALERSCRIALGAAVLNARIDRIDRLADGTQVIIDYKSGQPRTPDWLAERTTHPQLLVYLQGIAGPVSAMAVQHLTPKQVVYEGIADQAGRLPRVAALNRDGAGQDLWQRQLQAWGRSVQRLAQDFVAGHAAVDPAGDACRSCHLMAFCRIGDARDEDSGQAAEGVP